MASFLNVFPRVSPLCLPACSWECNQRFGRPEQAGFTRALPGLQTDPAAAGLSGRKQVGGTDSPPPRRTRRVEQKPHPPLVSAKLGMQTINRLSINYR